MSTRHLPIQVRAYPVLRSEHKQRTARTVRLLLVDDIETTTDTQRLLHGCGQYFRVRYSGSEVSLELKRCVLYYANDLPKIRPRHYLALKRYCERHPSVQLMSHTDYLKNVFLKVALIGDAAITGFNLSFDIWGHVSRVFPARGSFYYGGLAGEFLNGDAWVHYREIPAGIGMKREFVQRHSNQKIETCQVIDASQLARAITGTKHTLLSAGTAFGCNPLKYNGKEEHDPEANYHGPDLTEYLDHYISYSVNDVSATADLWRALMRRLLTHPIGLDPSLWFSPASSGKQYLRAMYSHAPLCVCGKCNKKRRGAQRIDPGILGMCMSAFFGGRAECMIRLTELLAVLLDFTSEYPTSMILLGLWELYITERIVDRDETAEVQEFLENVTVDDLFNKEVIPLLRGVATLQPDDDLLPVRTEYGQGNSSPNIGINHLTADKELTYSIPDLVASKIRTGEVPRITRAIRFYPVGGTQRGMKTIRLYDDERLTFNPYEQNLFKFLVEERQLAKKRHKTNQNEPGWNKSREKCLCEACERERFLKVFGNGLFGVFGEMNRKDRPKNSPASGTIYGIGGEPQTTKNPEESGEFCFPPFATVITGMGRLLLAMLQALVNQHGSELIACDTDSGMIPASQDGGTSHGVKLLTYAQVDGIRDKFNRLNPYDRSVVPELLKWEYPERDETEYPAESVYIMSISAKRYCVYRYRGNDIEILKRSEHGLGLYSNPLMSDVHVTDDRKPDWISEAWKYIIRTEILGQEPEEPEWFNYPAVSVLPVRTKHIWETLRDFNQGRPYYQEQGRPFSWHLAVHPSAMGTGSSDDSPLPRLIAPFTSDSKSWEDLEYVDTHTRKAHRVTTDPEEWIENPEKMILVNDYRAVLRRYIQHPENKYDDSEGNPCSSNTHGILRPCHVVASAYEHISKDSTSLLAPDEIFQYQAHKTYDSNRKERAYEIARAWLRLHGYGWVKLAREVGLTEQQAKNFTSNSLRMPGPRVIDETVRFVAAKIWPTIREDSAFRGISGPEGIAPLNILDRWYRDYQKRENETPVKEWSRNAVQ